MNKDCRSLTEDEHSRLNAWSTLPETQLFLRCLTAGYLTAQDSIVRDAIALVEPSPDDRDALVTLINVKSSLSKFDRPFDPETPIQIENAATE